MKLPRIRVSVRWLIASVLLIGGWLGWYVRGVRYQVAAVDALRRAHGYIGYEWEYQGDSADDGGKPWAPDWLVKRVGVDYFGSVVAVSLEGDGIDDDMLAIGSLRRLRRLDIGWGRVTDQGLARLGGISGLRYLGLSGIPITDAGVQHLTLTRLRSLILRDVPITDASLRRLEGLTGLEHLWLNGTRITDAGLMHLRGLTSLTGLSLENTDVTDAGLANLRGMTSLEGLWLKGTMVTSEGVRELRRSLPQPLEIYGVP